MNNVIYLQNNIIWRRVMEKNLSLKMEEYKEKKARSKAAASKRSIVTGVETQKIIDVSTGEVLQEQSQLKTQTKGAEPPFIKLYIDDLMLINDLPTSSSNILWELVKTMSYDQEIVLNASRKKRICANLNIQMQTLNNALTKFVKKEILFRTEPGIFVPNPYLFAKGSWNDVKELRMIVNYTPKGKSISLEINAENTDEDLQNLIGGN
ncbi:replication/maintenance protein RepL [Clostridium perfringens]|nr:replication/maintenance protein RepL [Clostridium perfringens]MDK0850287.1 replication/maintenance protein RepL [Clostridium perfringens]